MSPNQTFVLDNDTPKFARKYAQNMRFLGDYLIMVNFQDSYDTCTTHLKQKEEKRGKRELRIECCHDFITKPDKI